MTETKNTKLGIFIMLICTLFTASGQFFFKHSAKTFQWDIVSLLTNYNLILGGCFYAMGAFLLIIALKYGDLSVVYPFVSLTFIWVMLISSIFFNEIINNFKVGAVIFIIFGVALVGQGAVNGK
jgi:drug/metabolite transporter (DMT)-like permease